MNSTGEIDIISYVSCAELLAPFKNFNDLFIAGTFVAIRRAMD